MARYEATDLAPPGLIPGFNALGNHPTDMVAFVRDRVGAAYDRLGIADRFPEAEALLCGAIDDLRQRPSQFTGRHVPSDATRPLSRHVMDTFVRREACGFEGQEHYEHALDLLADGHNVVVVPNHTSPLDALVPFALFSEVHPEVDLPTMIMSQVFEYARPTRLLTSGIDKFSVFQPKHIRRFQDTSRGAAAEMVRQNAVALRALFEHAKPGGANVFLYLERDRNDGAMGRPEPAAVRVLELLQRAKPGLHILPLYITGVESIFPNRPGTNEIDRFFENIEIGQGHVICGRPIAFQDVTKAVEGADQAAMAKAVLDTVPEDPIKRRAAALAALTLGTIASLAPTDNAKGVYAHPSIAKPVSDLMA